MPTFRCSQCDFEKHVSGDLVGKKARCPKCKVVSLVTDAPVVLDVFELEDDESDELCFGLFSSDQDLSDDDVDELVSVDFPRRKRMKPKVDDSRGIPKPRSFLTTAILAGGFFGIGMGLLAGFQGGFGDGILVALGSGPLFGFVMAFFVSGRQVAVRFKSRDAFIKDMKRAFKQIKHEVVELSHPIFIFKHKQGEFLVTTHVHVGRREAIFVGPRTYVKKCVRQLADRHEVDWTGKKLKETHGESPTDSTAQYAWIAVVIVLLMVSSGLKDLNSPVGKAKAYVRSRVKVPSDLTFVSAKVVREDVDGKRIEVVFEAPNSFGVKLRDSMTVVVKSDGSAGEW